MGAIILPVLVKNRETSLFWSARRAMASAGIGLRSLRVLFIKLLLLPGGFPEGHKVAIFAVLVLSHFENDRVQMLFHPTDGAILFRPIRALIEVIGMQKDLLCLFDSDASF